MKLKKFNYKTVNSTNDLAIKIIKNSNNKSGIVIAENQKKGRGQYGKKWISYKGNLFATIFFTVGKINLSLNQITKINCLLIKKLLSFYYKNTITVKQPNDLLINKKKISGILQETLTKSNKNFIIVGVGINLIKNPDIINCPTTNLLDLTNTKINKNNVVSRLKKIYESFIPKLSKLNSINIKNI